MRHILTGMRQNTIPINYIYIIYNFPYSDANVIIF
jgi:hypothetical protein